MGQTDSVREEVARKGFLVNCFFVGECCVSFSSEGDGERFLFGKGLRGAGGGGVGLGGR